ncbi:MAG: CGNR zinc finger domain-containing protein [Mycobacterium sp.]
MSPSWPATTRYRLRTAPSGLALVQDLINTRAISDHGPDLLSDGVTASAWANGALAAWSEVSGLPAPTLVLTERDAGRLRTLRSTLRDLITSDTPPETPVRPDGTVGFALTDSGEVQLVPRGSGTQWLAAACWTEVLLGQRSSTWERLKRCREPACDSVFYDRSKNNSGVWHDAKTCGNRTNLRTSRARRRSSQG